MDLSYDDVALWPLAANAIKHGVRPDDADDAAQEALLYLIDRRVIERHDPERSTLYKWLWTIIQLRFREYIHRNYRGVVSLDAIDVVEECDPLAEEELSRVELHHDLELVRQQLVSEHHSMRSRIQLADFFASLVRRADGEIVSADVFNEWGEHTRQAVGNAKVRLRQIPAVREALTR